MPSTLTTMEGRFFEACKTGDDTVIRQILLDEGSSDNLDLLYLRSVSQV